MNTLAQYKTAHISSGASDLWDAAQIADVIPPEESQSANQLAPQVDEASENQPTDVVPPEEGQLANQRVQQSEASIKEPHTVDPHVLYLTEIGQEKVATTLSNLIKQANEPDPGLFTKALTLASGQTWSTVKATRANTIAEAKQLIDEGKFDQAFQRMNYASEGITQVTSPIEFIATGGAAAAKIAGTTALKVFAAGAPIEYTGTMVFEEVGEDNMLIGLAGEIASGVLAGNIGQKMLNVANKAVTKVPAEVLPDVARSLRPKTAFDLADPLNVYSNLGAKRAAAEDIDYVNKFTLGDLSDYRVRGAYENLVSELNGQAVDPETAGIARAIEFKVQQAAESPTSDYSPEVARQLTLPEEVPKVPETPVETPIETAGSAAPGSPVSATPELPDYDELASVQFSPGFLDAAKPANAKQALSIIDDDLAIYKKLRDCLG